MVELLHYLHFKNELFGHIYQLQQLKDYVYSKLLLKHSLHQYH